MCQIPTMKRNKADALSGCYPSSQTPRFLYKLTFYYKKKNKIDAVFILKVEKEGFAGVAWRCCQNQYVVIPFFYNCLPHPHVTDPVKHDLVEFFPSPSENIASPVLNESFNFTRPICGFPGAAFTYPAYIICLCLKKVTWQKGTTW